MGFLKDRIWTWGYVLDKIPSAAPFTFGKSRCSLETESSYLGAQQTFYMNTMFNPEYINTYFSSWDPEIIENCCKNRLSDQHLKRLKGMKRLFCTLEHTNCMESAIKIAQKSLTYKNIYGIHFDDFRPDRGGDELAEIHDKVKAINPDLKIAIVTYSHQDVSEYKDAIKYVDVVSRWRWVAAAGYWERHKDDIKKLRDMTGPDKTILQGIYIHDFGSSGLPITECRHRVPLEIFKLSVETVCQHTWDGTIDGFIVPQAAWFSFPSHREHVTWLKDTIEWFDGTTTAPSTINMQDTL